MRTVPIIVLHVGREGARPPGLAVPRPGVLPFPGERAFHALDLAVLPRAEGSGADTADALRFRQRVELPAAVPRPVVGRDAPDGRAQAGEEAQAAAHEGRAGALAPVGQRLGAGDPAAVADRDVRARSPGAARRPASAPQRPVPAAVGDAGRLLDVDVDQLARALPLVAHARDRAAGADLPGHAVDVGEARKPAAGHDSGAGAGGHAGRGRQRERGGQRLAPGCDHALLGLGRREPREPARAAAAVGEAARAGSLRRSHLLAVRRLTPVCRAASATPGPDSMRETRASRPLGVSFALGCCFMGGLLRYESRQLTACGNPPYLSLADVNNVLALNS